MPSRGTTPELKKPHKSKQSDGNKTPNLSGSSFKRTPLTPRDSVEASVSAAEEPNKFLITELLDHDNVTDSGSQAMVFSDASDCDSDRASDEDDDDVDSFGSSEVGSEDRSLPARDDEIAGYETDLEIDGDAWARGRESFDCTGFRDYVSECDKLGVVPVKYFIEHSQKKAFSMKNHGLGPLGIQAMTKAIELNFVLEKIDLEGNDIGAHGATCLADVLKDNTTVSELNLGNNDICSGGIESVCSMLLENTTIQSIDLSGNKLRDCDGNYIGEMLTKNSTLQKLYLRNNEFEENTAKCLRDSLCNNEYLKILDLSWNFFRADSCYYISDIVKDNYGLKYLNLGMNGLSDQGAGLIAQALKQNQCLVDLNLSNNRITADGAKQISNAIAVNETLETLRLSQNPIGADGAMMILESIHNQNAPTLTLLDIMGVIVCETFDKLHQHINVERKEQHETNTENDEMNHSLLQVLHGGVLFRNKHIMYIDDQDALDNFECDPLTKLRRIAEKHKYRLIDVFKQMDTDRNWALSKRELLAGGKIMGMEMTDAEVDMLITKLDTDGDGEIDYDELMAGDTDARKEIRRMRAKQALYEQRERDGPQEVTLALGTRDEYD